MNESRVFRDKIDFKIIYHRNQKMLEESYLIHLVSSGKDMASMMSSLTPFRKNRGKNTKEKRNDPDSAEKHIGALQDTLEQFSGDVMGPGEEQTQSNTTFVPGSLLSPSHMLIYWITTRRIK